MFKRRPTWTELLKLGNALTVACFLVSRRDFVWKDTTCPPGSPLPADVPTHRVRQYYSMRRLDLTPQAEEALMQVRNARMGVKSHSARTSLATSIPVAVPLKVSVSVTKAARSSRKFVNVAAEVPGLSGSVAGYVPSRSKSSGNA